jgi:glycolate oxidase subunit GlcD
MFPMALPKPKMDSLGRILKTGQLLTHPVELITYEVDAAQDRGVPDGVVFPISADEVHAVVRWANENGVPLIARGAGTGLSGGAVAEKGGILLGFSRMNRILEFDTVGRSAVVEPGVVNLVLDEYVKTKGLYFPPDPASGRSSTLGGNVAENSGGPHCFKYGVMTNYVTGLEAVLADGRLIRFGGRAMDYPEYDLCGLISGSEGTLAVLTKIMVRLLRNPPAVKTLMAVFDSVEQAGVAVSAVIAEGLVPATMEMMDQRIARIIEDYAHPGLPTDAGAILIIEVDGYPESLDLQMEEVARILSLNGGRDLRLARSAEERDRIWYARKSAAGAMARLAPAYLLLDGTVPRSKLAQALEACNRICDRFGLEVGYVFHAGDGNLHPLFLMYPDDPAQIERVHRAGHEFMEQVVRLGGSITGEHGVGIEKRHYMPLMYSAAEIGVMIDVKEVFDPNSLLNPGKIFADLASGERAEKAPHSVEEKPVLNPVSSQEAAEALKDWIAAGKEIRIRGGGTKSSLLRASEKTLSTGSLKGIRSYAPDDLYVTVGAGTRLCDLTAELAPHRMWVPLSSPWPEATIGGIVATNFNGPLRMRYGGIRDILLDATAVLPDGRIVRMGRPVVKNVAGYDMPKVLIGSHGTLGLISDVTLRLNALPRSRMSLLVPVHDLKQGFEWGKVLLPLCLTASALALCSGDPGVVSSPYLLVYTAEGMVEDVKQEISKAETLLKHQGAARLERNDSLSGSDLWAGCIGSRQPAGESPTLPFARLGLAPKDLSGFVVDHAPSLNGSFFFADIASGLLYLLGEKTPFSLAALTDSARKVGGYGLLLAAPKNYPVSEIRAHPPESLELMRRLKAKWDPKGLFNPGAFLV